MDKKIKIIFAGTPDFGIPALRALIKDSDIEVIAVVTATDKKVGRNQVLTPSPIKLEAKKNNITVIETDCISCIEAGILMLQPDVMVVAAFSQIIPEKILNIPKYGCINIHGSLLPKYRGAACVQAAILAGDKKSGVTIMQMEKGLDTGPILAQEEVSVEVIDDGGTLYEKISNAGGKIIVPVLKKYIAGEIKPQKQDDKKSNYVGKLKKEDGKIDWHKSAIELERFVRAMQPWPGAYTSIKLKDEVKLLKITKVEQKVLDSGYHKVGEIFTENSKLCVQTGNGSLVIGKLQLEGKKNMSADEFLKGHPDLAGKVLI